MFWSVDQYTKFMNPFDGEMVQGYVNILCQETNLPNGLDLATIKIEHSQHERDYVLKATNYSFFRNDMYVVIQFKNK